MRKISVIIPCYNVASYIDRCMTSMINQTIGIRDLEIICVDDASTDDTWNCLRKWEQQFPDNILLLRQEVNRRQGAARNLGLSVASADWISFVDADDWLEPDFFEKLYCSVLQCACDVAVCGWVRDSSETLVYAEKNRGEGSVQYLAADTKDVSQTLLKNMLLGPGVHAKIIRREFLLRNHIFFPEGLMYEDMYWYPLLHLYAEGVCVVKEYLYHYYMNPQGTVMSRNEMYHLDWFTVQMMKWEDYHRRGLFEQYGDILEYDALSDAAGFVKLMIFRFDVPPFSFFQLEREFLAIHIPDYKENRYASDFSELYQFFLKILYSSVSETEFQQMISQAKKSWGVSNDL